MKSGEVLLLVELVTAGGEVWGGIAIAGATVTAGGEVWGGITIAGASYCWR